ncbi:MAG: ATPase, T2SS/T4P/T4SS family [Halanaeroarchaeum sp.]
MLGLRREPVECSCDPTESEGVLVVDASECPGGGDLATASACRATVIEALAGRRLDEIRVERGGRAVHYRAEVVALFAAAGSFAARVAVYDDALARRARRDPLGAAEDAVGRVGPVAEIAAETDLGTLAEAHESVASIRRFVGPSIAAARIDPDPPPGASLSDTRVLDSGATARLYESADGATRYHLEPLEYTFAGPVLDGLAAAWRSLAERPTGTRSVHAAVRAVATPDQPVDAMARVLAKHARGYGVLEDLFADERVGEVAVNAPADETPLHVRIDDRTVRTNVRLTERGTALLASRIRRESGRAFSRADPTVDALLRDVGSADAVRVAGVRRPASDGRAFALRAEATDEWRLSTLVALDTVTPAAAGLLSLAIERGAAILVAGPRGGGKTTLASALLWELPTDARVLAIEDTPELPIDAIQGAGRDAQRLHASTDDGADLTPAEALRTALRLGDGALVVGEVRGPEAAVLYEAMRVGAASSAVLGTIHGEGAEGVRERVVSDLGVPESSFRTTDLVVTTVPDGAARRVASIEEVTDVGSSALFARGGEALEATGRIARGNSELAAALADPGESYADVRTAIGSRAERFAADGPGGLEAENG